HLQYVFVTSATALSGLTQSVFSLGSSSFTLTFDKTAPTATISLPTANNLAFRRALIGHAGSFFSGNSSDTGPLASLVKDVQVRISYLIGTDTYYWIGASFSSNTVASSAWTTPMATNDAWTYSNPVTWPSPNSTVIKLEARAEDNALSADNTGTG